MSLRFCTIRLLHDQIVVACFVLSTTDEPPDVVITGTNNGDPVIYGGPVVLECIPRTGIPLPTVTWGRRPNGAVVSTRGNATILRVDRVTQNFCVDCLGNSVAGTDTETECVNVLRKCPSLAYTSSSNQMFV